MLSTVEEWKFFRLPQEQLIKSCKGTDKVCPCGKKAKCIDMDLKTPTNNSIDSTYTEELVTHMLDSGTYLPVFRVMNDHLTTYMRKYCESKGKVIYGRDVIVSLKGGTVFSILAIAFLSSIKVERISEFVRNHSQMMKINDIDFEVFVKNPSDTPTVIKLSAMALYDVRATLLRTGVLSSLEEFSDGSRANDRLSSDNIVLPISKSPPKCRQCNTLLLPVPSVLRSKGNKWYRPDWLDGPEGSGRTATNLPISSNETLKRIFGAEVVLFRMRKAVINNTPSAGSYAEIYDIAIPLHGDPIHNVILKNHRYPWFVRSEKDDMYMCSPRYMYYTLRHTFFLEDIPPWQILKMEKKLARLVFCLIMVACVEEKRSVSTVLEACHRCCNSLLPTQHDLIKNKKVAKNGLLFFPFDEFVRDVKTSFEKFGYNQDFAEKIIAIAQKFETALSNRKSNMIMTFESNLDFGKTIRKVAPISTGKTERGKKWQPR